MPWSRHGACGSDQAIQSSTTTDGSGNTSPTSPFCVTFAATRRYWSWAAATVAQPADYSNTCTVPDATAAWTWTESVSLTRASASRNATPTLTSFSPTSTTHTT